MTGHGRMEETIPEHAHGAPAPQTGAGLTREAARREEMLAAVNAVAQLLLDAPLEACRDEVLELLGRSVGASRAFVYECASTPDGLFERLVGEWCAPGIEPDPLGAESRIDGTYLEEWHRRLAQHDLLQVSVDDVPEEARSLLARAGILSHATAGVFVDGAYWGQVGFDDCVRRRAWSPAETETLSVVARMIGAAVLRRRTEVELERRDAVLDSVGVGARLLLARPLEECAEEVLRSLGEAIGASRAYIYAYEQTGVGLVGRAMHSWRAEGVPPDSWGVFPVDRDGYLGWYETLRAGEIVHGPTNGLPLARRHAAGGVRSIADVPIFAGRELWGSVGFDDCAQPRVWSAVELEALQTAAQVIGAAIDRERTEDALRRSEEMLRQSQRLEAVGRLAGGVAHDFNNLLTVITGYLGLVHDALDELDPIRADVEHIRVAADRATDLTRQLLAFSGRQSLRPRPLDVNAVVVDTDLMLRRLIGADVELERRLWPQPVIVRADPIQLQQVLVNLGVNARDAMTVGGRLTIEVAVDEGGDLRAPRAVLSVTDTGAGMSEETRVHAFEPFFTTKEQGRGTGLGLATVHGIVTQSGGTITVDSELGRGTKVTIRLPLAGEELPVELPAASPRNVTGSETVLVAEDEPALRRLIVAMLEQAGYRVLSAADGAEALRLLRGQADAIDLVLSDVVMPRMGGPELVEWLGSETSDVPVLFMSGYPRRPLAGGGMEPGAPMLLKPFTAQTLGEAIRDALEGAGRRRAAR